MEQKIMIAGFGGQGVILAGNVLAQAALAENKKVAAMVSYGAEVRGGTANCTVIISDEEIASPVVDNPTIAIILNQPSLDKFEDDVEKNGLIINNLNIDKWAEQVEKLLGNPKLLEKYGKYNMLYVNKNYTAEIMNNNLWKIIQSI